MFKFVDHWIDQLEGIIPDLANEKEQLALIIANIKSALGESTIRQILFTGSVPGESLNRICKMVQIDEVTFLWGENICMSANTIEKAVQSDRIILVEDQKKSTFTGVEEQLQAIHALKKEVMGFILI